MDWNTLIRAAGVVIVILGLLYLIYHIYQK